jgi:hypothetical protein
MSEEGKRREKNRRGRNEGSIEELPSGKWRAVQSMGFDGQGKRDKRSETFETKRDALAWHCQRKTGGKGARSRVEGDKGTAWGPVVMVLRSHFGRCDSLILAPRERHR